MAFKNPELQILLIKLSLLLLLVLPAIEAVMKLHKSASSVEVAWTFFTNVSLWVIGLVLLGWLAAAILLYATKLRCGDRVTIVQGEFAGQSGTIVGFGKHEWPIIQMHHDGHEFTALVCDLHVTKQDQWITRRVKD